MEMNMLIKKTFLVSALSLAFFSSSALAAQFTDTGNINFNGEIADNTCMLSEQSRNLVVDLPVVTSSEFSRIGDYAGDKSFDIILEKCPKAVNTAKVSFDGERAKGTEDLFKAVGEGSGVGFAIFDNPDGKTGNAPLKLGEQSRGYRLKAGQAQLSFIARYRSTVAQNDINPGYVKGGGKFVVTYY
jgi:type 1 fimbria pilin